MINYYWPLCLLSLKKSRIALAYCRTWFAALVILLTSQQSFAQNPAWDSDKQICSGTLLSLNVQELFPYPFGSPTQCKRSWNRELCLAPGTFINKIAIKEASGTWGSIISALTIDPNRQHCLLASGQIGVDHTNNGCLSPQGRLSVQIDATLCYMINVNAPNK